MNENEFKSKFRLDVCSGCPKRVPCALADSICELVTPCSVCEIRDTCTSLCNQMKAYLSRGNKKSVDTTQFDPNEQTEDFYSFQHLKNQQEVTIERDKFSFTDIPWDAISERDANIVKKHFVEDKNYNEIAKELNISAVAVYHVVRGGPNRKGVLAKLKEFATQRRLLKKYGPYLSTSVYNTLKDYYIHCKSLRDLKKLDETAKEVYYRLKKAQTLLQKFEEAEDDTD